VQEFHQYLAIQIFMILHIKTIKNKARFIRLQNQLTQRKISLKCKIKILDNIVINNLWIDQETQYQ
jgi:hypothetical protein